MVSSKPKRSAFLLNEVSCERIEHSCEFATYVWFNQAKLVFIF